jgi:hypothetical protein
VWIGACFPGADADAKAVVALPIDATSSPARVALCCAKVEAEKESLKTENANLRSEIAQIPGLKGGNAGMRR